MQGAPFARRGRGAARFGAIRLHRSTRVSAVGFTAVEGLVLLSILGLLATLGAVLFKRHVVGERVSEATSMLTELANKEQSVRNGGGQFITLRADARSGAPDEAPGAFYPAPADDARLSAAGVATRIDDSSRWPSGWRAIDLRPTTSVLYCTYLVNTGERGRPDPSLRFGSELVPMDDGGPWFYALAVCNLDGAAGYPDNVTVFGLSSQNGRIRTFNEGR